jgi:2-oxoglutarate dehydrogenase E2 component (dihydrolipoamide succinyltransferase)
VIATIDTEAKAATGARLPLLHRLRAAAAPAAAVGAASRRPARSSTKGMAAADVAGSGRGGRVTKEDAVAAQPRLPPSLLAPPPAATAPSSAFR